MKRIIPFLFLLLFNNAFSQNENHVSIMQEQSEHYRALNLKTDAQFDSLRDVENNSAGLSTQKLGTASSSTCTLTKKVFGWHPYWVGTAYTAYQWNLLSDLCYFSYDVSPTTGNNTNTSFAWTTASVVTVAKNNGVKIHICATLFSGHSTFWASSTAQTTFINNIVSLLNARGGDGVNIDFEGMGSSDKIPFTTFMTNLNNALNTANPNYKLSVCLYAVDWSVAFDIPALNTIVDDYTIMGYAYYYSGSSQAGPSDPLYNFQTTYNYTLSKTITYYLKAGATPSKLLMGLPYYGQEWEVVANTLPANTTGNYTSSRTLAYINNNSATYSAANKKWDGISYTPYYAYQNSSNWRQCFIDDVYSLGRRYDMVNQRGLGGIAIWALGYDAGITNYWTLLQDKFTDCAPIVCNDSIFDMGGPMRNYYDNEKYTYTLAAPTGSLVKLQFKSFGTEQGYDSLFIYNGASTAAPLIGSYTGTNSPGTVTSTGQNLTLRFKSDGATVAFGFKAIKSCTPQIIVTGVNQNEFYADLLLYPNPTNGKLFLDVQKIKSFQLFDAQGKLILSKEIDSENDNILDFKLLNVTKGLFFIRLTQANERVVFKKIIYSE
ncbi:glycosyl hydrolase family 18 protein [Sediminibacterium sp.]|uniref:glycosyl hydrolase family 18 protein n=1 Tax=Sediminibacterium sp. TaxID=1917865 RepID=UPI00271869D2|nr:glycosyl hydrolase family 18 protein [Sediminibacterium sp.]MDO9000385.1 glycosyl hydrolase family 18 protein [Bacteroidota bacterium]MDP3147046.1 glycosyl hydrolase family 18 protein [Bacteroidota bacterium]MDP3567418.1 glycosyl hydrolase family 18 protein [Sediminibacterium sp.]